MQRKRIHDVIKMIKIELKLKFHFVCSGRNDFRKLVRGVITFTLKVLLVK